MGFVINQSWSLNKGASEVVAKKFLMKTRTFLTFRSFEMKIDSNQGRKSKSILSNINILQYPLKLPPSNFEVKLFVLLLFENVSLSNFRKIDRFVILLFRLCS